MCEIKEKSSIKILKNMIDNKVQFEDVYYYLNSDDNKITYEELVTQKIFLKLYWNNTFSESQKEIIVKLFCIKYKMQSEELYNNWRFIKAFCPLMNSIVDDIKNKIVEYFNNSLSMFIYCIGLFVYDNPDVILLPKNLIMSIASKVLKDDVTSNLEINSKIIMTDSMYDKRKDIIEYIYNEAIKYGVIYEQYDNISYIRSKVKCVKFKNGKPVVEIEMLNNDFEKSIKLGSLYDEFIYYYKFDYEPGIIHKYYKCKVCKYCALTFQDDEMKDIALELLNRQFKSIKTIDLFYLITESIPNYLYSIVSLLYTELILLILFSDDNYRLIDKSYIKNNMIFGNNISKMEFDMCISLICSKENEMKNIVQQSIPFFEIGNKIVIGRWMYNHELSLIEEVKNISFNSKRNKKLGEASERFGKNVFENIVRMRFKDCGWNVVEHSIKLKDDKKQTKTDVDLVAFKSGVAIIGQIKVANCGRSDYQIWKAGKVIERGIEQAIFSEQVIRQDSNLLYSILKKNNIVGNNNEIKDIIYIVITTSNYFNKIINMSNVSVIGIELLDEWLVYTQNNEGDVKINDFLNSPFDVHDFNQLVYQTESIINTETFKIIYNEFEVKQHDFEFIM
ncbi:hypothetical protein [Clostridium beijerinckii]|uniref:hypothetical protein n=1 Tax=Clostridium beijerinckii TaxID=1520 RepID=UPI0015707FB0|nr:hypothetical protein [Clostridium beijerinckii]